MLVMKPDQVNWLVAAFDRGFFIWPESVRSAFRPPLHFNVLDEPSALKAGFWIRRDGALPSLQTPFLGVYSRVVDASNAFPPRQPTT